MIIQSICTYMYHKPLTARERLVTRASLPNEKLRLQT